MANFFFGGGPEGYMAWNLDRVTYVVRNPAKDSLRVYFAKDDFFELSGEHAKQFIDVLTRLQSEANKAWQAAKSTYEKQPVHQ